MPLSTDQPGLAKFILERIGRQLAQTALPIVLAAGAVPGRHDARVAWTAIAIALLVTLLKAIAGIRAKATDPLVKQLIDRAAPAFAGTWLGFVPADVANMGAIDWGHVFWASLGAGAAAVVAYYVTPPSNVVAVTTDPLAPKPAADNPIPGEAQVEEYQVLEPDAEDL